MANPKTKTSLKQKSDVITSLSVEERAELQSWTISGESLIIPTKVKKKGDIAATVLNRLLEDYGANKVANKLSFEGVSNCALTQAVEGLSTWNSSFVFPHEHNRCNSSPGIQAMVLEELRKRGKYQRVLEPSAGIGELAQAIRFKAAILDCVESNESRCAELVKADLGTVTHGDFMQVPVRETYDLIVMYPPLWAAEAHYVKARLHLKKGGKLIGVLPANSVLSKSRDGEELRKMNVTRRIVSIEHSCVGRKNVPLHVCTFE